MDKVETEHVLLLQTYALSNGAISRDTAIEKSFPVIRGVTAREGVQHWELIFPAFTAKRKISTFNTFTVENILGWVCLISTLKEPLFGVMEHLLISITGHSDNRTTFTMRIVSTPLGYSAVTNTDGTMSIVQIATNSLARKVQKMPLQ